MRIINSYNKTACLKYQFGFCRWICQNGMIFESKSVDFVFTHTKGIVSEARIRQQLAAAARERIGEIRSLEEYYSQFGANAYAAMNVLTDFASYPKGLSGVSTVPVLQAKAGAWIDEFVEASDKPGFNMTNYLGADAIETATWYDSLTAA